MNPPVQIDLVYLATTPLGVDLAALMAALQTQVTRDFAPIWGIDCKLSIQTAPRTGVQRLLFLDDTDQADALGEHELTPDGLPQGKVFVQTTLRDGENPTVTASHELLEMLVDPNIDQVVRRGLRAEAKEVADAVEETGYAINGIQVSNFQTPAWFELHDRSLPMGTNKYDFLGLCTHPWQILKGGYMSVLEPSGEWTQVFGSIHAANHFRSDGRWRGAARVSGVRRRSAV